MALVTANMMAKMIAAVSSGKIDFAEFAKRHKIPEAQKKEHEEYWDDFVTENEALPPGATLSPPSEWS